MWLFCHLHLLVSCVRNRSHSVVFTLTAGRVQIPLARCRKSLLPYVCTFVKPFLTCPMASMQTLTWAVFSRGGSELAALLHGVGLGSCWLTQWDSLCIQAMTITSPSVKQLKLVNPSQYRFEHLVTQMKWRLQEGRGEAVYQIGVEDNGLLVGLSEEEMRASLKTLRRMAEKYVFPFICRTRRPKQPPVERLGPRNPLRSRWLHSTKPLYD